MSPTTPTPGKGPTPGPWRVEGPKHEGYAASVMGADGHLVVNLGNGGNGRERQLANAALIACAPETAAERDRLREVVRDLIHLHEHGDPDGAARRIAQARAALGLP